MKNIGKAIPILAPVVAVGAVAWGAAASLGGYTTPVYGSDEFQIAADGIQNAEQTQDAADSVGKNQPAVSQLDAEEKKTEAAEETTEKAAAQGDIDLADGSYEGTGTGFHGTVRVSVKIKDRLITAIDVLSHSDDESFFDRAKEGVIQSILSSQSMDVDVVSGATYSSRGIINAVKNALYGQAGYTQPSTPTPMSISTPIPKSTPKPAKDPEAYKNGTYTGTGTGFGGKMTVQVKIAGGKIKTVKIKEHADGDEYIEKASSILNKIVKKQGTDVDVVSGATYSSNGILEGVKNAIEAAKEAAAPATPTPTQTATPAPEKTPTPTAALTETPKPTEMPKPTETTPLEASTVYVDGEYKVTVPCEPDESHAFEAYNLTLTLVMKDDTITEIKRVTGDGASSNDNYITRASKGTSAYKGVVPQILEKNSVEGIDAVTRATCTSRSIIEACRQALENAKRQ